jgi:hypothetical protein
MEQAGETLLTFEGNDYQKLVIELMVEQLAATTLTNELLTSMLSKDVNEADMQSICDENVADLKNFRVAILKHLQSKLSK